MRMRFSTGLATILGVTMVASCGLRPTAVPTVGSVQALRASRTAGSLSIFAEPETGSAPIVQAIEQAQTSIKLGIYLFLDKDPACQQIASALIAAAQHGRQVEVMLNQNFYTGDALSLIHI